MVGILLSYWGGLFSGAMLVSGRVDLWKRRFRAWKPPFSGAFAVSFREGAFLWGFCFAATYHGIIETLPLG